MKSRKTLTIIMAISLILGSYRSIAQTAEELLPKGIQLEEVKGELGKAIAVYQTIVTQFSANRPIASKALIHIGLCNEKLGNTEARKAYESVVRDYPDQTEMVALAKTKLTQLSGAVSESNLKAEQSFKLAGDLYKQFKYESAITEYEKVIQLSPKSRLAEESRLWIGQSYFKEGEFDLALSSFKTLTKEFPESTIVPVTEVMISQVQQAKAKKTAKNSIVTLDNKTILDPATGIKYTKINTWKGKYDIITNYSSSITDISPNRRFLLYENKIIPFDNSDPINLYNAPASRSDYARFSPDGTQIAIKTKKTISVIPISQETGRPTGPAKQVLETEYNLGSEINWSSDGNNLTYYLSGQTLQAGIWTLSIKDNATKQVTGSLRGGESSDPVFSKDGSNILYSNTSDPYQNDFRMASRTVRKSAVILRSSANLGTYSLARDNNWILGTTSTGQLLYRLADKQIQEFTTPPEVGARISWSDQCDKVLFYCSSFESQSILKVTPITGGSTFDLGKDFGQFPAGWSPDGTSLIAIQREDYRRGVNIINLTDLGLREIEGIPSHSYSQFSKDFSQLLMVGFDAGLSILPVSLKDGKVTGDPIPIFQEFSGVGADINWSPDGRKIAVCSKGEVYICDSKGGEPIPLTKTKDFENYPLWSPDGKTILVYIHSGNQVQILSATDGHIIKTFEKVDNFAWSPNGQELAVAFLDGKLSTISMDSERIREIADWKGISHFDGLNTLAWSPDGSWIAMNGYNEENEETAWIDRMYVINATDGKATELDAGDTRNKGGLMWSPDSKWIFYNTYGPLKTRLEGILWEADLADIMKNMKPGTEKGYTTDLDIKALASELVEPKPDGSFTDSRDGHVYKYKNIGDQTWMVENLAFLPKVSPASANSTTEKHYYVYDYNGADVKEAMKSENYRTYGVLYNWPAAMNDAAGSNLTPSGVKGICPDGWHLPSEAEWIVLEKTLGGMTTGEARKRVNGSTGLIDKKIKMSTGWFPEDDDINIGSSGFNAIPGGFVGYRGRPFLNIGLGAYFHTATETAAGLVNRALGSSYFSFLPAKNIGQSVRCVKD